MENSGFDLGKLLAPIKAEEFLKENWEREPLVVRRDTREQYEKLFTLADLDSVVAFSQPRFTEAGAFPNQAPPSPSCVQGYLADSQFGPRDVYPDVSQLQQVYAHGKTVVIRAMHRRWPAVATLCRNLEAVFQCPVHANLYLTPPHSQGFDAHIDPHEVFALQIDGTKVWRLYGPAVKLPLVGDRAILQRARLGKPEEIRLKPGDLLYLPRGYAHEAFTNDDSSLHLTIGINIYRWVDLLRQAVDGMARTDARFRESIPSGSLLDGVAGIALSDRFRELLGALAEKASLETAVARLGGEFLSGLPMLPQGRFTAQPGVDDIGLNTVLAKSPGAICRCTVNADTAAIQFPGGQISGPARIGPALQFIAGSHRFAVRELPDDLGVAGNLVLAKRLIRERLLMIESHSDGTGEFPVPNSSGRTPAGRASSI